jgi:hypothetical protein
LCQSIEQRGIDPFIVEIDNILPILREYYPEWKDTEELCLDAEALHRIASTVESQSKWVKQRTSSLYTDPFILENKLRRILKDEILNIFLKSWHPIVEFEQASPKSLREAADYWKNLLPRDERWKIIASLERPIGVTTRDELADQQIISDIEFSEELENLWQRLKQEKLNKGKIEYWDFIGADTYQETVRRAYITSFLITYGYAVLEVNRLEEIIFIRPQDPPNFSLKKIQTNSLPISVSHSEWEMWRQGERK